MIANPSWDNFRAKFTDNSQKQFERLCYLLFCKEFGKDIGIFRFKNHAGIETDPIKDASRVIGWQAKFYSTKLSENKQDLVNSINTTATRYPNVNTIIFYTNQEFGQDAKKTDPQYKTDIESHAKIKGIDIEWRTASHFESPFVCEQNFTIAEHFFSLKKGIIDSIMELQKYTDSLLKPIHSEILFSGSVIKLDRSVVIRSIKDKVKPTPLLILSGGAGVGKTAVIKDLYETVKESAPFFVFKASQFKDSFHINELFKEYGEITSSEFINEHKDIHEKYIVIDSAERLSEIEDQDVFRIFHSNLAENGWNIILTVRYSYLDDLRFQLKEIYGANFTSLNIPNLSTKEFEQISMDHKFTAPKNERLANLLLTPLYLSEYLQSYTDIKEDTSYADFRKIIWRKQIQNSGYQLNNLHIRREESFLKIARQRANEGGFSVKTSESDHEALQRLESDEIIKYDSSAGGYFITHDVYEEWALDITIERSFINSQDYHNFYCDIGNSLPVRRAFRCWLSDKLLANDEKVKKLIEFTIKDSEVENHWKDEVIVSALLSDYSKVFFDCFEEELLKETGRVVSVEKPSNTCRTLNIDYKFEQKLLPRVVFLLRIACKTIDEELLNRLGLKRIDAVSLKTVFTIPKGSGWHSAIGFINKHKEKLQLKCLQVILPALDDWNLSYKQGETTKNASQIALFYYEKLIGQEGFYFSSRDNTKDQLIRIILNGSAEIKVELKKIIDQVVSTADTSHRSKYYDLVKAILSSIIDSSEIGKHLPKDVIRLANLFWFYIPPKGEHPYSDHRNDIEQYFDLMDGHLEYYPASAFQTPIWTLLQTLPQEAVDFIISFTNRSIEYFSKSKLGDDTEEIDVVVDDYGKTVKQYISQRIWNIYRGTVVAPPLLESVHMVLEKWLLMAAKAWDAEVVEKLCLYLMKNSRSASITAIVVSAVLAEPTKLFNVAKILFRTKDFFFFDSTRKQLDTIYTKPSYSLISAPLSIFRDERMQTCEDKHRNQSLESQALHYQLFATDSKGEDVSKKIQDVIWKIFDEYYAALPDKSKETESDKTWRLCLARVDCRKMKISTERKDDQVLINFNPEIDPELRQYSEDAQAKSSDAMKYLSLQLWAHHRFEEKNEAENYPQYESNHSLALSEIRAVLEQLKNDKSEDRQFTLFYCSLPSYVCAILLRDYFEKLKTEEAEFCKDVMFEYSSTYLSEDRHQVVDGLDAVVHTLPLLLKRFPKDAKKIREALLFILFGSYPIGMSQRVSDYAISAILQHLWKESPSDANTIFHGYLLLKPKFDEIGDSIQEENRKKHVYDFSRTDLIERFKKECADEIDKIASNQFTYNDVPDVTNIDVDTLVTAFLLIPLRTDDENHKNFLHDVIPVLIKAFKSEDKDESFDYALEQKFLNKFAHFVLTCPKEEIESYVRPFTDIIGDFRQTRNVAEEILEAFVIAEDFLNQYNEFWTVWQIFYPKIVELCSNEEWLQYSKKVVLKYLLALEWKRETQEWHSLKDREKIFFKKVSEDMGNNSAVLYAIAKLLNDIGSRFAYEGIGWISNMLEKTPDLTRKELEVNTVYYLENLVRSFVFSNRQKIKTDQQLKRQILVILNFLLEKASTIAYLLREAIL